MKALELTWWKCFQRGDVMGKAPQKWGGPKFLLRKTFDSDELAARDGYSIVGGYYVLGDDSVLRKDDSFLVNVTTRTPQKGWVRIQVEIPVAYGDPWKEELKEAVEKELKKNHDLIGVFLSDIDYTWRGGFDLSWEDEVYD